jgi:lactate dehydrogenase-like 2-hydroxyacid dehydrogenase
VTFKVLICDLVGLRLDANGEPDASEVRIHIEAWGGAFFTGDEAPEPGKINFYYKPHLATEADILPLTDKGQFDAVIAAATRLPKKSLFREGGVRIGAGTGNMQSECLGTTAPLMNTPGFNSRATAQMAFKALLRVRPDLPVQALHTLSVAGLFDTGRDLRNYPTRKLEGQTLAVIGYGNIGREMARLAAAFHMKVKVFARDHHRARIEADGFAHAVTAEEAAAGADVLSVHVGLGAQNSNMGFIADSILQRMNAASVLINYDRGECVEVAALERAMESGIIAHAAIDADIFVTADGSLRGPLVPYLPLEKKFPGRIDLLPHAAADTDHPSRVAGAKQAVDQIIAAIRERKIINGVGSLPPGYGDGGPMTGI